MEALTDVSNILDALAESDDEESVKNLLDSVSMTKSRARNFFDSDSESETENKSPNKKPSPASARRKAVISDDSDDSDEGTETKNDVSDKEEKTDSVADEMKADTKKDNKKKSVLSSDDSDSDDEAVRRGRLLRDADLYDDEISADDSKTRENNSQHGSDNSAQSDSDDGIERTLSNKYRKPASKQAQISRPSRRAKSAADETIKIYSEKQRLIREQCINIKVYEPPKLSLVEFLRQRDPNLAELVSKNNKSSHRPHTERGRKKIGLIESMKLKDQELRERFLRENSASETSSQEPSQDIMKIELSSNQAPSTAVSQPIETQDLSSQPEDLETLPQGTNSATEGSLPLDLYDTQRSEDYTQSDTEVKSESQEDTKVEIKQEKTEEAIADGFSSIMVQKKTDEERKRREAKKAKLKALLGDSIDLDSTPRTLQPDENGMVNLDSAFLRSNSLSSMKNKDDSSVSIAALSVVKVREDGSQEELSMSHYINKTADQLGGKSKLTILKEILQLKIEQKRIHELKQKEETLRMEMMEEDIEGDDADDESESDIESDREETPDINPNKAEQVDDMEVDEGGAEDGSEHEDGQEGDDSESETEQKYMKRAKAVVDSDNEEDLPLRSAPSKSLFSDSQSIATNSVSQSLPAVCDSQPIRNDDSQPLNPFDTKSIKDLAGVDMLMNTQEAEDELGGLLSGTFNTQPVFTQTTDDTEKRTTETQPVLTIQALDDIEKRTTETQPVLTTQTTDYTDQRTTETPAGNEEENGTGKNKTVIIKQKTAALNFSDEESETETTQKYQGDKRESDQSDNEEDNEGDEGHGLEHDGGEVKQIQRIKKSRKRELMNEWMDDEAELSGSDVGDDEIEGESDEEEMRRLCDGDNDDVGTDSQIKKVIGRLAMKQQKDKDDRELILYKERFLADGELHSNTIRKRKFKWSNVSYRDDMTAHDDNEVSDQEETEENRQRDEKRKEFENFCRQKRLEDREKLEQELDHTVPELDESQTNSQTQPLNTANSTISTHSLATRKRKKIKVLAGFSKDRMEDLRPVYKDFKLAEGRTVNAQSRKFTFQTLSREAAANQNDKMFNKA